jgi:hypothetical protein
MRENVLRAGWLSDLDTRPKLELEEASFQPAEPQPLRAWNQEDFAREQILGLVRQVFLGNAPGNSVGSWAQPVRQVVFSAMEREADLHAICRQVGGALAQQSDGTVGILARDVRSVIDPEIRRGPTSERRSERISERRTDQAGMPLRRIGTRVRGNFWLVPPLGGEGVVTASLLHSYVSEMRREFEYSIIEAPPVGESHDATAMAQFADGIILVLSAHRTRRVTACKVKEMLEAAQVRILGTVLGERLFPIPNEIYRRL